MALLPDPTPPQVRALASVLNNLIRDAPSAPADPGQQELGRDGQDPVCLQCGAWYRRLTAGEPAGCPACGSQEALLLPAAGDQRREWCQAFGDLALARLRPAGALGLAPPVLHALLSVLRPWVQVPGRSLHRLSTSAPSYLLVVAGVVPCARRPTDSGPLLESSEGWHYDAGDHGRLRPSAEPRGPQQPPYAIELQCSSCGRLRAAGVCEASPPPPPGAPWPGLFCTRLDSATPVTVDMASRAVVVLDDVAQPGALPLGRVQGTRCEPPPPEPGPLDEYASFVLRLPHDPLEHLHRSPPDMGRLRVVTANCGGLGSDPRKVPRLMTHTWPVRGPTSPTCRRRALSSPPRGWPACRTACAWGPSSPGEGWSPWSTPAS